LNFDLLFGQISSSDLDSEMFMLKMLKRFWEPVAGLRNVTCHMESRTVLCHPTHVNAPSLVLTRQAGFLFTYPGGMKSWVDLGTWLYTETVFLSADSHSS